MRSIVLGSLVILVATTFCPTQKTASQEKSQLPSEDKRHLLRVHGVLVDKRQIPLAGKQIAVYPRTKVDTLLVLLTLMVEKNGDVSLGKRLPRWNPEATTDKEGRFVLEIARITKLDGWSITDFCFGVKRDLEKKNQESIAAVGTLFYSDPKKSPENCVVTEMKDQDEAIILRGKTGTMITVPIDATETEINLEKIVQQK